MLIVIAIFVSHVSWNELTSFGCTTMHLHHCAKWACAHLKPPLPVSLLLCAVASQNLSQNPPIPPPLSILSHSLLPKVNKVKGLAGPFTMQKISTQSSKPLILASGLPEATTLPTVGHLPLITTSYSAWPSLIIQPIPFCCVWNAYVCLYARSGAQGPSHQSMRY